MAMTFGIHVGHLGGPLSELRRLWRFADERGFDWFSVSDHFQESPPQGGDGDCFEGVATLTAAALETRIVRLGCLVFCVSYRNPGLLAKSLTAIDHLSGGRVECGIGAGWHDVEYRAFGIPFAPIDVREDQLEEYAQVLRLLFDQKVSSFTGRYYQLADARNNPRPLQSRLRIWIGGQGEKRTLRAAARHADGWNGPYLDPPAWRAKNAVLDDWCRREGRDPADIIRSANVGFYLGADEREAARQETLLRAQWGPDLKGRRGFLRGTPRQALEVVAGYRDAGVARLNLALRMGPYEWEALHAFAEEVLPAFGSSRPGGRAGERT
ncbi:MAG TPA: LLM class flavin-dependent oxidoreductase [Methylomirabilota bacterium]|jgi:alkanesulfonate monooxygenase SsuD/methylene tetrahydromethanopterin reductase-like flavin-dependent oxidoreductase (luciferase family)|nr:LLM class flavin-dependent oxidoreductase [Methylomirabilota bacterium]